MLKKLNVVLFVFILTISYMFSLNYINADDSQNSSNKDQYKAKVTNLIDIKTENIAGNNNDQSGEVTKNQYVKVKVLTGNYKNKEYEAVYCLKSSGMIETKQLKLAQEVLIQFDTDQNNNPTVTITDVYRINYLIILIFIFIAIILLIGKLKGIKTLISVTITILGIIYILIPMITHGHSAIFSSMLVCVMIAIISLILIGGFNKKSFVAIIGTISGVVVAGVLAIVLAKVATITGLTNEESQMLFYISDQKAIDIKGIFFAGILIGAVGATMDISMSIASTMMEITKNVRNISVKDLIKAGMNVGKDSMGTMSNTLILAYVGESLNLLILFVMNNSNVLSVLNSDYISSEILRSLAGTIGMLTAIPITAVVYGLFYGLFEKTSLLNNINMNIDVNENVDIEDNDDN